MTKFNVGDKVQFIEDYGRYVIDDVVEVTGHWYSGIDFVGRYGTGSALYERFKLAKSKPTKNQRITALENEVAELRPLKQEVADLKLIVHELRGHRDIDFSPLTEPSTINTVEDIIEFEGKQYRKVDREAQGGDIVICHSETTSFIEKGKPYKVSFVDGHLLLNQGTLDVISLYFNERTPETVDVYELIESKPLTPNQQRAEIIEKAKEFIDSNKRIGTFGKVKKEYYRVPIRRGFTDMTNCTVDFITNEKKRTVVVICRGVVDKKKYRVSKAKCNPSDVFNEHIGKAIALGRALGLDVSEFEQAAQPTVAVGQLLGSSCTPTYPTRWKVDDLNDTGKNLTIIKNEFESLNGETADGGYLPNETWYKIINDTNAKY